MDGDTHTGIIASLETAVLAVHSGLETLWSWLVQIFFVRETLGGSTTASK